MTGYELHPEAIIDLDDLLGWIASDSPDAAHRVASTIEDALRMISRFPNAGHLRPDLSPRSLRFHVVYEYLIAYAPGKSPVCGSWQFFTVADLPN
ncbi:MAG: type II toxin-antitoxin system RelE/ParE family toxin [Acidobacteriaceae bacterium]